MRIDNLFAGITILLIIVVKGGSDTIICAAQLRYEKVDGFLWNRWTESNGFSGRIRLEWVDDLEWNQWTVCSGIRTMAESGEYKMIVWDTAPTITTLNLLFIQELFYSHLTQAQKIYLKVKKVFHKVDPLALIDQWRSLTLRIIELLQTRTSGWVVANPECLPVDQARNIADSLNDFSIRVNGFIMNKVLSEELCKGHPFLQAKFTAQQKYRQKLRQAAKNYAYKEIPELTGEMSVDGLLGEVAGYLQRPN